MVAMVNGWELDFTECGDYGMVRAGEQVMFRGTWHACVRWAERH